jgi:hypothetical protein
VLTAATKPKRVTASKKVADKIITKDKESSTSVTAVLTATTKSKKVTAMVKKVANKNITNNPKSAKVVTKKAEEEKGEEEGSDTDDDEFWPPVSDDEEEEELPTPATLTTSGKKTRDGALSMSGNHNIDTQEWVTGGSDYRQQLQMTSGEKKKKVMFFYII